MNMTSTDATVVAVLGEKQRRDQHATMIMIQGSTITIVVVATTTTIGATEMTAVATADIVLKKIASMIDAAESHVAVVLLLRVGDREETGACRRRHLVLAVAAVAAGALVNIQHGPMFSGLVCKRIIYCQREIGLHRKP
jgi:hypothetical protein